MQIVQWWYSVTFRFFLCVSWHGFFVISLASRQIFSRHLFMKTNIYFCEGVSNLFFWVFLLQIFNNISSKESYQSIVKDWRLSFCSVFLRSSGMMSSGEFDKNFDCLTQMFLFPLDYHLTFHLFCSGSQFFIFAAPQPSGYRTVIFVSLWSWK